MLVSGYVLTLTEKVLANVRSNVGVSYALYDEGAFRNEAEANESRWAKADMRTAPEALRVVSSSLGPDAPPLEAVELGRFYGDANERTLRVVHNEPVLHPFQPYDVEATANQLDYFERVFDLEFEMRLA